MKTLSCVGIVCMAFVFAAWGFFSGYSTGQKVLLKRAGFQSEGQLKNYMELSEHRIKDLLLSQDSGWKDKQLENEAINDVCKWLNYPREQMEHDFAVIDAAYKKSQQKTNQ